MTTRTPSVGPSVGPIPGAPATAREIAQQPETWRAVAEIVASQRGELDAFLGERLSQPGLRIVLTGAGTSAFVGDIAAPALARELGRRVDAVATTDIVSDPRGSFSEDVPTLLVSFARSGNSPESIAATALADELLSDIRHLVITCDSAGRLYQEHASSSNSFVLLMPEQSNDEGFAMTSSFTSMLLAVLLVFGGERADVEALSATGDHILGSRQDDVRALVSRGFERVVYLGSGPLAGLAHESSLKMLELTAGRVVAYFDSSLGFRHGPKAILDPHTLVVVFVSSDPYTRAYDLDIVNELRAGSTPVTVIAVSAQQLDSMSTGDWVFPDLESAPDAHASVVFVLLAQLLALWSSARLGLTPDNPFPGGLVNRVVRGVSIHPLSL